MEMKKIPFPVINETYSNLSFTMAQFPDFTTTLNKGNDDTGVHLPQPSTTSPPPGDTLVSPPITMVEVGKVSKGESVTSTVRSSLFSEVSPEITERSSLFSEVSPEITERSSLF